MRSASAYLCLLLSCQLMAQVGRPNSFDEVSRRIGAGDCNGADLLARSSFQDPMLYTVLGIIQLDCRKNKKGAVDYFMISARQNESLAIDRLILLGEAPPQPKLGILSSAADLVPLPAPPPMPSSIQAPPMTILISPQVQVQPMMNLNACIQDGGPIFCPNHPNTRSRR
jgi:hypothetical protein